MSDFPSNGPSGTGCIDSAISEVYWSVTEINVMPSIVSSNASSFGRALPNAPARPQRVIFLDVVRGLAALCVLLHHTTEESSHAFYFWSFRWFNPGRRRWRRFSS